MMCCLGLVWFADVCDEEIHFGMFSFTFGKIAHGEHLENEFPRFGATTILVGYYNFVILVSTTPQEANRKLAGIYPLSLSYKTGSASLSEGFAVQRQEGERKFAIILAFTHSRNGFGEYCPFLWARVSPTKLPWRSSHRAALLSPEPWRVIPFSLPFLSLPRVGGTSKRVCGTCVPPTTPTLTANQAMARELAIGLQGLEGCHPTPDQVLEIHTNYANERGKEREERGVGETCRRNAG